MVLELIIFFSAVVAAYCIGNVTGFVQGKNFVEEQLLGLEPKPSATHSTYTHLSKHKHNEIDDVARYAWAWNERNHTYEKVYDAEIIEFPGGR